MTTKYLVSIDLRRFDDNVGRGDPRITTIGEFDNESEAHAFYGRACDVLDRTGLHQHPECNE